MDASYIPTAVVILSVLAAGGRCIDVPGSRKCSDLCVKLPACISFKFQPFSCECTLETKTKQGGIVAALKMSSALNPSSKNFFQFLIIRLMLKNVQDKHGQAIQTKENLPDRRGHLLIIPDKRERKVLLLNLHKLTKKTKMKIIPGIVAMAYMASIERLIISKNVNSKVILSYDLKKRSSKIIVKGFAPKAIAVDEEKKLIFFIHGNLAKPRHFKVYLYKFKIGFRSPSVIKTFKKTPAQKVLVNSWKQRLFCGYNGFILEINYNGETIRKLLASFATRGMCFDSEMQTLYYISRTYVKGVNLANIDITENIINLHKNSKGLTCYNNTLFVMSLSNRVLAVNLNSRVIVDSSGPILKANLKFPMCTVP